MSADRPLSPPIHDLPASDPSVARLAEGGLRLTTVDTGDRVAFRTWLEAEGRGFHESPRPSDEAMEARVLALADRRSTAVYDDGGADPVTPVATVSSWIAGLTLPGGSSTPAWAISAVTVAPTHRRRGIARALIESELDTALRAGCSVAMLTVSEATIYARYGFGPAVSIAAYAIDTRRASWTGPAATGRVQFVGLDTIRADGPAIIERQRLGTPGLMEFEGYLWDRLVGFSGDDAEGARKLRAVRYDDEAGVPQGFAVYTVTGTAGSFTEHVLDIVHLASATDEAYGALWRFLLEMDLVKTVTASLRSVDEPLRWQISDVRAITTTDLTDHLWTRLLDVPAALEARRYGAAGRLLLEVADPLGYADGRFLMEVDAEGRASVGRADGRTDADAVLALSAADLGSLYLGGVSAVTLVRAGRVREVTPGAAASVDAAFHSAVAPWLSIWF
jgi:predicted acetyltransferase